MKNIKGKASDYIDKVSERGLDSLGIISVEKKRKKVIKVMPSVKQEFFTDSIEKDYAKQIEKTDSSCLIHMRKSSIGAVTLANGHPYIGERYVLAQNGTSKDLHGFFKIKAELEGFNIGKYGSSDSAALLSYIEHQGLKSLTHIQLMLDKISDVLGIIFVYDKETGQALIYSDGCRELYIEKEKNKLLRAENYKSTRERNWYFRGHVIFMFETGIIKSFNGNNYQEIKAANNNTYYNNSYGYNYGATYNM